MIPETIRRHLNTPGLDIQVHQVLPSTNTALRDLAEAGAPEGTVVLALGQTAGRGRRDRSFFSPGQTGLYLSLLVRPDLPAQQALLLTTCAAVAVAQAIEACAGVEARIKWVNDVFCQGKKVCGILTEGSIDMDTGRLTYAVVGIGVNLAPPAGGFPADLPEAGAVFADSQAGMDARAKLAAAILDRFFGYYPTLTEKSFFADYRARSLVLGQPVHILGQTGSRPAVALDLTEDFGLVVREADGGLTTLDSGEVSIRPR